MSRSSKLFAAIALALVVCFSGAFAISGARVSAAGADGAGEGGGYVGSVTLSSDSVTIDGEVGYEYSLTVYATANAFASYQLRLELPYFVEDVNVIDRIKNTETDVSKFFIDAKYVYATFSSSADMTGRIALFDVTFKMRTDVTPKSGNWALYADDVMFTDSSANTLDYSFELGYITIVESTVVKGDFDGDGEVTIKDVMYIQQYIVTSMGGYGDLTADQFAAADINGDKVVNILDCQYIQMYLVGKIDSLEDIGGGNSGEDPSAFGDYSTEGGTLTLNSDMSYRLSYCGEEAFGGYLPVDGALSRVYLVDNYGYIDVSLDMSARTFFIEAAADFDQGEEKFTEFAGAYSMSEEGNSFVINVSKKGAFFMKANIMGMTYQTSGRIVFDRETSLAYLYAFGWGEDDCYGEVGVVSYDLEQHKMYVYEEKEEYIVQINANYNGVNYAIMSFEAEEGTSLYELYYLSGMRSKSYMCDEGELIFADDMLYDGSGKAYPKSYYITGNTYVYAWLTLKEEFVLDNDAYYLVGEFGKTAHWTPYSDYYKFGAEENNLGVLYNVELNPGDVIKIRRGNTDSWYEWGTSDDNSKLLYMVENGDAEVCYYGHYDVYLNKDGLGFITYHKDSVSKYGEYRTDGNELKLFEYATRANFNYNGEELLVWFDFADEEAVDGEYYVYLAESYRVWLAKINAYTKNFEIVGQADYEELTGNTSKFAGTYSVIETGDVIIVNDKGAFIREEVGEDGYMRKLYNGRVVINNDGSAYAYVYEIDYKPMMVVPVWFDADRKLVSYEGPVPETEMLVVNANFYVDEEYVDSKTYATTDSEKYGDVFFDIIYDFVANHKQFTLNTSSVYIPQMEDYDLDAYINVSIESIDFFFTSVTPAYTRSTLICENELSVTVGTDEESFAAYMTKIPFVLRTVYFGEDGSIIKTEDREAYLSRDDVVTGRTDLSKVGTTSVIVVYDGQNYTFPVSVIEEEVVSDVVLAAVAPAQYYSSESGYELYLFYDNGYVEVVYIDGAEVLTASPYSTDVINGRAVYVIGDTDSGVINVVSEETAEIVMDGKNCVYPVLRWLTHDAEESFVAYVQDVGVNHFTFKYYEDGTAEEYFWYDDNPEEIVSYGTYFAFVKGDIFYVRGTYFTIGEDNKIYIDLPEDGFMFATSFPSFSDVTTLAVFDNGYAYRVHNSGAVVAYYSWSYEKDGDMIIVEGLEATPYYKWSIDGKWHLDPYYHDASATMRTYVIEGTDERVTVYDGMTPVFFDGETASLAILDGSVITVYDHYYAKQNIYYNERCYVVTENGTLAQAVKHPLIYGYYGRNEYDGVVYMMGTEEAGLAVYKNLGLIFGDRELVLDYTLTDDTYVLSYNGMEIMYLAWNDQYSRYQITGYDDLKYSVTVECYDGRTNYYGQTIFNVRLFGLIKSDIVGQTVNIEGNYYVINELFLDENFRNAMTDDYYFNTPEGLTIYAKCSRSGASYIVDETAFYLVGTICGEDHWTPDSDAFKMTTTESNFGEIYKVYLREGDAIKAYRREGEIWYNWARDNETNNDLLYYNDNGDGIIKTSGYYNIYLNYRGWLYITQAEVVIGEDGSIG